MQQHVRKTIASLNFPVLSFSRGMVFPARTQDDLCRCTKTALNRGFFNGLMIVDASGRQFLVRSARKVRGIGAFWGYNIFLNQRIQVELDLESAHPIQLEELRRKVLKVVRTHAQWNTAGDIGSLDVAVSGASSVAEIVGILTKAYFRSE